MSLHQLNVISLGAGVQSSTMALMAAHGEIEPMPDAAIFADTQWEPPAVYEWLGWLAPKLPFPVLQVTAGNLREATINHSRRSASIPWFIKMPGADRKSMGRRQCTKEYKLRPIQKKVVELLGGHPRGGCSSWIGISTDEATRMKPSQVQYICNRWPLIEKRMSRNDCLQWMKRHAYPEPPRSSCIGCPFHNDIDWRTIKANPQTWADAVEVDAAIRHQPKFKGEQYAHRSMVPLDQVDFRTAEDHGQLNIFQNECEGLGGV